ncbi:putative quinol monooxygenase [Phreatobacter sp. HK31-P]
MQAFNVVKFQVKPGQEQAFLDAHRDGKARWPGLLEGTIIRTGDQRYCLIGKWESEAALVAARPAMIATLDTFRPTLDEMGPGKGITDAVSGAGVLSLV